MINAAIVGLGRWGQNLVNSVQGKSEAIRFVAGVLRHPDNAREYADKQGLALHDNLQAVLDDPAIDAMVLATPHTAHAKQILAAARAGKHVFTEKPFTLTRAEAAEALRVAKEKKVTLAVGYNWRFQPALQEIRAMLEDGRLGKLLHIEGNFCGPSAYRFSQDHWRQSREEGPGGGMTGRGVHVVDAMLYLGGRMDSVYSQSFRIAQEHGIDDTTSMLFRFASGATAYLGTVIATAETWRMQVFGSRGWVEVGDVEHLTTWQMRVCYVDPNDLLTHHKPQILTFPETSTERAELEHFAHAAQRGEPLAIPGGDEEHGVAVFEAIMRSAQSGASVRVGSAAAKPAPQPKVDSPVAPKTPISREALKKKLSTMKRASPEPARAGRKKAAAKTAVKKAALKQVAVKKKALKKAAVKKAPPAKQRRAAGKAPAAKRRAAGKAPAARQGKAAGKASSATRRAVGKAPSAKRKATKK